VLRWTNTPSYVFPKPISVVRILGDEFGPVFAHHLWVTMYEFLAGYAIGAVAAVTYNMLGSVRRRQG
jgi:ABC-type nitrate/sulfonate/bicarbonate transport system permease component